MPPYTTVQITGSEYDNLRERDEIIRRSKIRVMKSLGYYSDENDIYEKQPDPELPDPFVCHGWDTLINWQVWNIKYDSHDGEQMTMKVSLMGGWS